MSQTVQTLATVTYGSVPLPVDGSVLQSLVYNGSNQLTKISINYLGVAKSTGAQVGLLKYSQTFTYTGANLTTISEFIPEGPAP